MSKRNKTEQTKRWINTQVSFEWNPLKKVYEEVYSRGYWYDGPLSLASTPPTMEVTNWAFYNDGTESGSTIIGSTNTNPTLETDTIYLVRFGLEETSGNNSKNTAPQLQYNHNFLGWNNVNATSSVVRSIATANITDGADTTQRITAFTYDSTNEGFDEVDGIAGGGTADLANNGFEALYSFQILSADVADSDSIVLKIVDSNDADNDYDVYNQTDPTITVSEGAAYSITGAVTVNSTIASTMDYTRNASIAGAVTVNSTIAATMAYNRNASITGAVTVNSTIASGMVYAIGGVNYSITGDVTVNSTIAATLAYNRNASITGDVTVNSTIAAGMVYEAPGNYTITGDVTVNSTIAATLAYNRNASIAGDVTVNSTIASGMVYAVGGANYTITGDVTVNSTIAATTAYNINPAITGDVTINNTIAGTMLFTLNAAIAGDVSVNFVIASTMDYTSFSQPAAAALSMHTLTIETEDHILNVETEDHILKIQN